jgi:hypothetical protein
MAKDSGIKNTSDLRSMLLNTIEGVRAGTIDATQARVISTLSTTILQSAKIDLDYIRFHASEGAPKKGTKPDTLNLIAG